MPNGDIASSLDFASRRSIRTPSAGAWGQPHALALGALVFVLVACLSVPGVAAQSSRPAQAASASKPDAIILSWNQLWTLRDDRTIIYEEHRQVQINHERAIGEFADPRITYDKDTQQLEILHCRTKRPDGRTVDLPKYAQTDVAPEGCAGFPAFAAIQQRVLVMPAIEPGAVLELGYRITTKPAEPAEISADIRLADRYPVIVRQVRIDMPRGAGVAPVICNVPDDRIEQTVSQNDAGGVRMSFIFTNLPGIPGESHGPAWQLRQPRFAFCSAGSTQEWLINRSRSQSEAADASDLCDKLAPEWTKGAASDSDKFRAIQEKLAKTFTFVAFDPTWKSPGARPASRIVDSNYGTTADAAIALIALARAAHLLARPAVIVADAVWLEDAPHSGNVLADLVAVGEGSKLEVWHPQFGRVQRDKRWNDASILLLESGELQRISLPSWNVAEASGVAARASIAVAADGTAAGSLSLRQTGLFVNCENLRSQDAQRARVRDLTGRVLPGFEVASFTVQALGPDEFEAQAQIKSAKQLEKIAGSYRVALGLDGPSQADVALPLAHQNLRAPIRLGGAFTEHVHLEVRWPAKWVADASPPSVEAIQDAWGRVEQSVSSEAETLILDRTLKLTQRDLDPTHMRAMREAINQLRSEKSRTLLLKPD